MEMASRLTKEKVLPWIIALFFGLAPAIGFAQAPPPGNQETALTFVHDFLQFFYPEVVEKGKQLILCVAHPADASWREISGVYFKVTKISAEEPNPLAEPNQTLTLLGGSFWLTPQRQYGRIFQMLASSDVVHEKQLNALRKVAELHPEWSQAQAIQALKAAGARYGPAEKEDFMRSLHLEKAEKFLGKIVTKRANFNGLDSIGAESGASASFVWVLQAQGEFPDGTRVDYILAFEPFEGKLIYLSRH